MKLHHVFFYLFLIAAALSCRQYRYVYAGSKTNTPMLTEKGDSRLNASYSSGESKGIADSSQNRAFDLQAAYAISNHFAVMAAFVSRNEADHFAWDGSRRSVFTTSFVQYNRRFTEIGAGYFSASRGRVFSLYGGIGLGRLQFTDAGFQDSLRYSRRFSSQQLKLYLQPGLSFLREKGVSVDLSLRFSWVDYKNVESNYSAFEEESLHLNGLGSANPILFIEPSFTFSLPAPGLKWLRLETGYNTVINRSYWNVRNANFFIGLTTNPIKLFREKK